MAYLWNTIFPIKLNHFDIVITLSRVLDLCPELARLFCEGNDMTALASARPGHYLDAGDENLMTGATRYQRYTPVVMMAPVSTLAFVMTKVINIPRQTSFYNKPLHCLRRPPGDLTVNINVKYLLFVLRSTIKSHENEWCLMNFIFLVLIWFAPRNILHTLTGSATIFRPEEQSMRQSIFFSNI